MPSLRDPDEFLEAVRHSNDPELANLWKRVVLHELFAQISEPLSAAAFDALTSWAKTEASLENKTQQLAIEGAFTTIRQRMRESPHQVSELAQCIASYFQCTNFYLAFAAVRQFDVFLGEYTQHVSQALFDLATSDYPTPVPGPMSLRAIAFKVLFQFNPEYAKRIELKRAKDECINGCMSWELEAREPASGAHHRELVARIVNS